MRSLGEVGPMLTLPPCSGLVRGQTEESMKEVHPQSCAEFLVNKSKDCRHKCCKEPEFGSIPAEVGMGVGLQESRLLHTPLGGVDGLGVPTPCSPPPHSPGSGFWLPSSSTSLRGSCGSGARGRRWSSPR